MKDLLAYVESKRDEFSRLPLFEYLQDESIDPIQRLAFAPCAAPFIMSFGELNKYAFRDENNPDKIQKIINKHTYEDDHHWIWFLEDIEKLGLNPVLDLRDALTMLWEESTVSGRRVAHELYRYTYGCAPLQKLAVIEAAEATGNVMLRFSSQVTRTLEAETQQEYRYFGSGHLVVDTGHTYCSAKTRKYLDGIQLDADQSAQLCQIVDHIFVAFTDFMHDLLAYAKTHPVNIERPVKVKPLQDYLATHYGAPSRKKIGSYLVEAGLVKPEQLSHALAQQKNSKLRVGDILVQQGWVTEQTLEYVVDKVMVPERKDFIC